MRTTRILPCAVVLAVLGWGTAQAQELLPAVGPAEAAPPGTDAALPPPKGPPAPALSSWIANTRPECCGPYGGSGPIRTELFVRGGISLPVEGEIFGHVLKTGWEVEGGGRSLFFNRQKDAGWGIDVSVSNIFNHGQHSDIKIPYNVLVPNTSGTLTQQQVAVSVNNLNRTFFNVGLGREWYLLGDADNCKECRWRVGIDALGRLGAAKVEFDQLAHHTDVASGVGLALHSDWEWPTGCCTFMAGFRVEWDYNWMDILQLQNDSDMMDVNLLFTVGVRF